MKQLVTWVAPSPVALASPWRKGRRFSEATMARNVDRGIRAQRHHVHVGPEAAALGQHAIAEQAAQIDHVGQIVVAGRIDVIGIRLRHAHRVAARAHSATA